MREFGIAHGVAAIFHDESAPGIALEIGQRLGESLSLGEHRGIVRIRHVCAFSLSFRDLKQFQDLSSIRRPSRTTSHMTAGTSTAESVTLAIICPAMIAAIGRTP